MYFILWVIMQYYDNFFAQIISPLAIGSSLVGFCVFSAFHLVFSCHSPGINHLSWEHWFCYRKLVFTFQDLGTRCDRHYWGITASRPFKQTELGNIYLYTNPHIHTYPYLFLYLFVYILKKKNKSCYWYLTCFLTFYKWFHTVNISVPWDFLFDIYFWDLIMLLHIVLLCSF